MDSCKQRQQHNEQQLAIAQQVAAQARAWSITSDPFVGHMLGMLGGSMYNQNYKQSSDKQSK